MKSVIILVFLYVAIASYLIQPVIPVIDYLINKDYIAKNLCVNKDKPKSCCKGKCYLIKQLKKNNSETGDSKKDIPRRVQLKEFNDFILNNSIESTIAIHAFSFLVYEVLPPGSVCLSSIYVPPEFLTL